MGLRVLLSPAECYRRRVFDRRGADRLVALGGAREHRRMGRLQEPFRTIVLLKAIGLSVLVVAMAACLLYVLFTGR